ncbi:uncharacterized protein BDR25DRAFT_339614 [Lindgomyces ingoldianus]|uniref:Uncharacterized protein n=1 Tax=Lindgomyces ingoldianus TaxID=673940 RepID=A0ACB6RDY4_9PLEO|nr:uncharacterized protein BDR25DRAFT_339614 [Lindgomyces ingoldianus]KAF2476691.1 hypothetical protein BDR25DRAFT_339614 [Lindgomyces ingoldianus]
MDSLVPWLGQTIERGLAQSAIWLEHKYDNRRGQVAGWAGVCHEDESNFDIIFQEETADARNVQVLQTAPLIISDGISSVEARVSPECKQTLRTRYGGKRCVENHLTAIISIHDFALRIATFGPPSRKLTLLLKGVDWRDGQKVPSIGRPVPVNSSPSAKKWMEKIQDIRMKQKEEKLPVLYRPLPLASVGDNMGDATQDSQLPFGTQAVPPIPPPNTRKEGSQPAKHTSATTHQDLLNLIHRRPVAFRATSDVDPSRNGVFEERPLQSKDKIPRDDIDLKEIFSQATTVQHNSKLPDGCSIDTVVRLNEETVIIHDGDEEEQADPPCNPSIKHDLHVGHELGLSEAVWMAGWTFEHDSPQGIYDSECDWMRDLEFIHDAVIVAKDQRKLLSKPESWQKPAPPHRFPDANIPIGILIELDERAGQDLKIQKEELTTSVDVETSESEMDTEEESGSDAEKPSIVLDAEFPFQQEPSSDVISWPSSPEPPQLRSRIHHGLPSDSSFGSPQKTLDQNDTNGDAILHPSRHSTSVLSSNDEHMEQPASSPPVAEEQDIPMASHDSDDDMEVSVPQGLGQDQGLAKGEPVIRTADDPVMRSEGAPVRPILHVNETPCLKDKNGQSTPLVSTENQTSSSTSKETTPTSIVYSTYEQPRSSASNTGLGLANTGDTRRPSSSISEPWVHGMKHVHFQSTNDSDVLMRDASPELEHIRPSALSSQLDTKQQVSPGLETALNLQTAQEEPSPASAQMPPLDLSSQPGHMASHLPRTAGTSAPSPHPEAVEVFGSDSIPSKRKLNDSPSKATLPRTKRREIKIVDFGGAEPLTQDPIASFQRQKKEAVQRIRVELGTDPTSGHRRRIPCPHPPPSDSSQSFAKEDENLQNPEKQFPKTQRTFTDARRECSLVQSIAAHGMEPLKLQALKIETDTESSTVFEMFRSAYPDYTGSWDHFINQCKTLLNLASLGTVVPRHQWDDYIIRDRIEFKDYVAKCMGAGKTWVSYDRFYKDHVQNLVYRKGIIKGLDSLLQAIGEYEDRPQAPNPPSTLDQGCKPTRRSLPWTSGSQNHSTSSPASRQERDRPRDSLPKKPIEDMDTFSRAYTHSNQSDVRVAKATSTCHSTYGASTANISSSHDRVYLTETTDIGEPGQRFREFVKAHQSLASLRGGNSNNTSMTRKPPVNVLSWTDDI